MPTLEVAAAAEGALSRRCRSRWTRRQRAAVDVTPAVCKHFQSKQMMAESGKKKRETEDSVVIRTNKAFSKS
jgi:hypothetical protein